MAAVVPHRRYGLVDLYTWNNLAMYGHVDAVPRLPRVRLDNELPVIRPTTRLLLVIYWLVCAIALIHWKGHLGFARLYVGTMILTILYGFFSAIFPADPISHHEPQVLFPTTFSVLPTMRRLQLLPPLYSAREYRLHLATKSSS